jgi:hypothetical protein
MAPRLLDHDGAKEGAETTTREPVAALDSDNNAASARKAAPACSRRKLLAALGVLLALCALIGLAASLAVSNDSDLIDDEDDDDDDDDDGDDGFEELNHRIFRMSVEETRARFGTRKPRFPTPPHQSKIDHFVVLYMENHAADNLFGCMNLPGFDGVSMLRLQPAWRAAGCPGLCVFGGCAALWTGCERALAAKGPDRPLQGQLQRDVRHRALQVLGRAGLRHVRRQVPTGRQPARLPVLAAGRQVVGAARCERGQHGGAHVLARASARQSRHRTELSPRAGSNPAHAARCSDRALCLIAPIAFA